jgi:hypothetical protein
MRLNRCLSAVAGRTLRPQESISRKMQCLPVQIVEISSKEQPSAPSADRCLDITPQITQGQLAILQIPQELLMPRGLPVVQAVRKTSQRHFGRG